MKRQHTFRTIIIVFFIILAIYYIIPTFTLNTVEQREREKIALLSSLTGLLEADIYTDIYRDDIDFNYTLSDLGLTDDTLNQAFAIVDYLRTELYGKLVNARGAAIKQGLDLQGGMHLVMEVDLLRLIDNLARKKDSQYYRLTGQLKSVIEGTDLEFYDSLIRIFAESNVPLNTYFGDLRDDEGDITAMMKREAGDAVDRSLEILRNRVDQFGVSEPSVQRQGSRRIVLELPGVQDPARARQLVGKTALLEFKLLAEPDKTQKILSQIDRYLKNEQNNKDQIFEADSLTEDSLFTEVLTDSIADTSETADTAEVIQKESQDKVVDVKDLFGEETSFTDADTSLLVDSDLMEEHPFYTLMRNVENDIGVPEQNYSLVNRILHRSEIQRLIPSDYQFLWSKEAKMSGGNKYYRLYYLKKEPELTGAYLRDAQVQIGGGSSPTAAGQPIVTLEMNRQGARVFSRVTGANVGKLLAIVLDNKVHMAPRIKTKIPDGRAIIEGADDMNEARDLAIVLRAGALPAPVDIIEERTVGPSLGHDSVSKGATSALVGLALVILFMIWYYRMGGFIADIALVLNMLFVMSVLAGFHGTLTLPGIAGIILTIGMAVDANVLIYERIREEWDKGNSVKNSIKAGYSRAIVTILDANITTLIAAVVLYQFGTGPIKGFALTLMIGIIASMFTAIVVTRAVFDWITDKFDLRTVNLG